MKIKSLMPFILVLLLIFACKNNEEPQEEDIIPESDVQFSPTANEISRKDSVGRAEDSHPVQDEQQNNSTPSRVVTTAPAGRYIKTNQQGDNNCGCYCLDINPGSTSELCLIEDTMYITTRMEKSGNNINVYFVEPSPRSSEGKDIPWQEFDKNTPIATITPQSNGEIELDWLGFTINGDLAMDYAIYGKKTLEGVYKKK